MSTQRQDVEFGSQGTICRAWLYRPPAAAAAPAPCIVMAHGLGGTRDAGLEPYAEKFATAGYAVLLFDYRHFGASDGEPRQLLSIGRQLQDWAAAIAYARSLPGVDPAQIALWGSSFSGGHVIVAAARDGKVAAVSAQGPMMDGLAAALNLVSYGGVGALLKLSAAGLLDQARGLLGLSPHYVPLIAAPGQLAAMSSHDSVSGYGSITPPGWRNQMSARLALHLAGYRPIRYAGRLPCPVLILVCGRDSVAPAKAALATARKAGSRAELKEYDIGHFDIYTGEGFARSSADQLAFFNRVLRGR
jgi:dienelactone hydrolase